ncbi:hypothetical protein FOZ76_04385 [Verticiella sediminum]|uniref:Uncharacterized protein n=1 Tax=Verticiella sediminum TaxID=1247510 RepID=A0A556AYK9_9BURK|nr:hypothetical protein [Verticiella sediminum]TSH98030.1 hypothetical protein FOZ76_04385 [Verticiella sediminum]
MTQPPKKTAENKTDKREAELDRAIDDTFPASDPVSPDAGKSVPREKGREDAGERELDEALDETFPASDPLPVNDPDHANDRGAKR